MKTFDNLQYTFWREMESNRLFSQPDFRVRTYRGPEVKQASTESAQDFGVKSPVWLANYDRDGASWKTSRDFLTVKVWQEFSGTWPRWGMMRTGDAWTLPMSVPRTSEAGYSLLPTPQASDNRNRGTLGRTPAVNRRVEIGKQLMLSMLFDGAPCPCCVESMMGFPIGWTDLPR